MDFSFVMRITVELGYKVSTFMILIMWLFRIVHCTNHGVNREDGK